MRFYALQACESPVVVVPFVVRPAASRIVARRRWLAASGVGTPDI
jgi:hypothetical protein